MKANSVILSVVISSTLLMGSCNNQEQSDSNKEASEEKTFQHEKTTQQNATQSDSHGSMVFRTSERREKLKGRDSSVTVIKSRDILWTQARTMINAHTAHNGALRVDIGGATEKLKGLTVDAQLLRNMINTTDAQGNYVYKEVFLMPAVKEENLGEPEPNQRFTIVLVGVDQSDNIVTSTALDYCDPCPQDCPLNIDEVLQ